MLDLLKKYVPIKYNGWLGDDPNLAFLISLGAGPWHYSRRYTIQKKVIDYYIENQLQDITQIYTKDLYPLSWQNVFLSRMIEYLVKNNMNFTGLCLLLKKKHDLLESICLLDKTKNSKVLNMFKRDFLRIPSFPIDRRVKRNLLLEHLPVDSNKMLSFCFKNKINPNMLNRAMFGGDNPYWKKYIKSKKDFYARKRVY